MYLTVALPRRVTTALRERCVYYTSAHQFDNCTRHRATAAAAAASTRRATRAIFPLENAIARDLATLMARNWTHRSMLNLTRRRTIIIAADCA